MAASANNEVIMQRGIGSHIRERPPFDNEIIGPDTYQSEVVVSWLRGHTPPCVWSCALRAEGRTPLRVPIRLQSVKPQLSMKPDGANL